MKYFLYANNMRLYSVPKKYWHVLAIIEESTNRDDDEVNEAITTIVKNCNVKLVVSAVSQFL